MEPTCRECLMEINRGAKRCRHCGALQSVWKSRTLLWGNLISSLVVAVALLNLVWKSASSLTPDPLQFTARMSDCGIQKQSVEVTSFEANKLLRVTSLHLSSISQDREERMQFGPMPLFLQEVMFHETAVVLPLQTKSVPFAWSESTSADDFLGLCGTSCRLTFTVGVAERIDLVIDRNVSSTLASCEFVQPGAEEGDLETQN